MTDAEQVPKVSVIVLNYNGAHLLPDCLESLRKQNWPNLEVLVADNGSTDDSRKAADAHGARFLALGRNHGFSRGNNLGAAAAAGEFLFFLNNDTRADPSAVRLLAETLTFNSDLFVADPQVLDWEGTRAIHHPFRFEPGPFFHSRFPGIRCAGLPPQRREVPWGCGSSLFVRRWMFESLGGFDRTFFFDWDDADLCWRGWLQGWKTVHVPEARIYHKVGATFKEAHRGDSARREIIRAWEGNKNYLRFVLKVMPPGLVGAVLLRELIRLPLNILRGHGGVAWVQVRSFLRTLVTLPDILHARRKIRAEAVTTSAALIRAFLHPRPSSS